jgi:predicted nucleotidyltransferase
MKKTLQVVNQLMKRGLITDYAIGDGIAAIYYSEPILTYDLDIFVIMHDRVSKKGVIQLTTVYNDLKESGYKWKGEHIIIEGVPVQFIPSDELETEAIKHARTVHYEGTKTKILPIEYLIAILVRAGRDKDVDKVKMLMKQADVTLKKLEDILTQYKLQQKFDRIIRGNDRK